MLKKSNAGMSKTKCPEIRDLQTEKAFPNIENPPIVQAQFVEQFPPLMQTAFGATTIRMIYMESAPPQDIETHATTRHIQIKETRQVKTRRETRQVEARQNNLREDETNLDKTRQGKTRQDMTGQDMTRQART